MKTPEQEGLLAHKTGIQNLLFSSIFDSVRAQFVSILKVNDTDEHGHLRSYFSIKENEKRQILKNENNYLRSVTPLESKHRMGSSDQ